MQTFLRFFIFILFISVSDFAFSQSIKGRITGSADTSIPFAVVYDETSLTGTTSNEDGYYELKLDPGKHTVVFKAMGYYPVREEITLGNTQVNRDIQLNEQPVQVKEVIIRPGKEDPAYAIMRKVISLAPYHQSQVKQYVADVYLRGTAHIVKMPKFISKRIEADGEQGFKTGDVYMEESVNEVTFHAPDDYNQKVISIRSTFPSGNDEINPMGLINSSLYQPEVEGFISPLSPKAFQYYKYKYEGFIEESGKPVFKIQVNPKNNSQQLMRGTIFIVDQLWCLHSADVSINMFFGSLNYKIIYSPVKENAWLPVSYQFYADASIMGIKANFKYASSVKFKDVVLNVKPVKLQTVTEAVEIADQPVKAKTKNQREIEELLAKEELTNRDMMKIASRMSRESKGDTVVNRSLEIKEKESGKRNVMVEDSAMNNDTAYWNRLRPIPLSEIESKIPPVSNAQKVGQGKDTLVVTIGNNKNRNTAFGKLSRFVTNGAGFKMFGSKTSVRYNGLIGFNKFDFNTVDGFVFKQTLDIDHRIDSSHNLRIRPGAAWAFNRERFMWWTHVNYEYAPFRRGNISLYAGSVSADYNGESGINSSLNTLASLFFRRNYLKVYQQNQLYLENKIDLANGLNFKLQVGYRTAMPLMNHSDFSFFYKDSRDYSDNIPGNRSDVIPRNIYNEEAYLDIKFEYTPRYYYRIDKGRKIYEHSKWPVLFVRNRVAIPGIVNSTANYHFFETGLRQELSWELMHEFSWSIQGGFFLNNNRVYAMDDKYFYNQDIPVHLGNTFGAFRLLPFYRYAINDKYGEAHIRFTTPYLLFKYLPFLSNKLWVENLHLNYLAGGSGLHYWEAGYSMGKIYMIADIGFFAGFIKDKFRTWGVQLSFDF